MLQYIDFFDSYEELLEVTDSKDANDCLEKLSEYFKLKEGDLFMICKAINYIKPNM